MRCTRIPAWDPEWDAESDPGSSAVVPTSYLAGPPISVVSLLRREGRGPHTVGRPLAPRGHSREPAPPSRRNARKAAAAAGALFAVGALIAPAVLHDTHVTSRADAGSPSTHGGTVDGVNAPRGTGLSRSAGSGPVGLALAAMIATMAAEPPLPAPGLFELPVPGTADPRPTGGRATPNPVFDVLVTAVPLTVESGAENPGIGPPARIMNADGKPGNGPPARDEADGKPGNGPPAKNGNADGKPGNGPPSTGDTDGKPGNGPPAKADTDSKPGNGPPAPGMKAGGGPADGPPAGGKARGNDQAQGKQTQGKQAQGKQAQGKQTQGEAQGKHAQDGRADGQPGNGGRGEKSPGPKGGPRSHRA